MAGITKAIAITLKQIEWGIPTATIAEATPLTLTRVSQETLVVGIAVAIASKAIRIGRATATRMTTKVIAETVKKWVPLLTAINPNRAKRSTPVERFHLRETELFLRVRIKSSTRVRTQVEADQNIFDLHGIAIR